MENMIMEFGLKDGLFAGLFIWLLIHVMKGFHSLISDSAPKGYSSTFSKLSATTR